jgi:predicted transcriptional regulator of viral defense system
MQAALGILPARSQSGQVPHREATKTRCFRPLCEVLDDLVRPRPLLRRYDQVDVAAAEAVERMIGGAARVDPNVPEPISPGQRRRAVLELATRETTLVDLVIHPDDAGGLSNVATVIVEIGDPDVPQLARLAAVRSRSVARRLGWLLDQYRDDLDLEPLREAACTDGGYPTRLVRALPARGPIDARWNLQVNSNVEADL